MPQVHPPPPIYVSSCSLYMLLYSKSIVKYLYTVYVYCYNKCLRYILLLLTGLATKHVATQRAIALDSVQAIHKLEQISSDEHLGSLAENLLGALKDGEAKEQVDNESYQIIFNKTTGYKALRHSVDVYQTKHGQNSSRDLFQPIACFVWYTSTLCRSALL